jgi:hypothetical protein
MRMIEYPFMLVMGGFLKVMETICEAWQRIKEYENMKSRGYTLMQDEKGDDFWVGYGD